MLRLSLPVGTGSGKPGLAELAAEVAAELKVPTRPGGSLRGALARLGAALEVQVAVGATSFEVVFPPARTRDVLATLAAHLRQPLDPVTPVDSFDALRVRLATRLGRGWLQAPILAMVDRMRTGRKRALAELISEINLRSAAEVAVFQRAHYGSAGCVLAMWVPGASRAALLDDVVAALPPWLDVTAAEAQTPLMTPLPPQSGLFWAPRDGPVEVAVFVPQPSLDQPLAAEMLVLFECLTHDGLGGRLGLALEAMVGRDVAFEVLRPGETDQLVLLASADEGQILPLWTAVSQVLDSFRTDPPRDAELREAAARVHFRLLELAGQPNEWLRLLTRLTYRRAAPDALDKTLLRLATPAGLDLVGAIPDFCRTPLAFAVVGGKPPAESSRLVQLVTDAVLPAEKVERLLTPADLASGREEGEKYLAEVVEAIGGKAALREVRGYRDVVESDTGIGPTVQIETIYRDDGRMRQVKRVLATSIRAEITPDGGSETAGSQRVALPVDEAARRLAAAARHPLLLAARWLRGEIAFRVVALRLVAGREQAVLEEITDRPESLRLTIDTQARLVRVLEVRTWDPEVGPITVREEFADYRTVGGRLRAPFLRTRSLDQGESSQSLRTLSFDPTTPADDDLR